MTRRSAIPEALRRFSGQEPEPERPPPPAITIALATGLILAILMLALPALATMFAPPPALIIPSPATIPTAIVVPPSPALATSPVLAATDSPAGPPAGLSVLPATVPAGATPDDRMFTAYAGWPYRPTGNRQGDSCEVEIWPYGNAPSDFFWIDRLGGL